MNQNIKPMIESLIQAYPALECCRESIMEAFLCMEECYFHSGKILFCGNGGSAADCEHIVGELMKGFLQKRKIKQSDFERMKNMFPEEGEYLADHLQGALPAISLVSQSALAYAYINDVAPDMVFAQQLYGYAKTGDVLVGISTSGNSENVVNAVKVAKVLGVKTIGMTGSMGGRLQELCDITIMVPAVETYKIQEFHLPVYHALCAMLENEFFES